MTRQTHKIAKSISFAFATAAAVMFMALAVATVPAVRAAVPADIQNRIAQTATTWRASLELHKQASPDPHMTAITRAMNRRVYSSMIAQAVMEAISRNPANAAAATNAAFQAAPELQNDIVQNLSTAFPTMASTFAAPFPPIRAPPIVQSPPPPQAKPQVPAAAETVAEAARDAAEDADDDPLEGFNRVMFGINDFLDTWLLVPISEAYRFIMPETLREMGRNFFENLNEPVVAINDLLQGDLENAGVSLGRFAVNSTIGLFGFFEVAEEIDLKEHPADFGQTLHSHGLDSGPFIVLPFFGPSTVRDALGAGIDSFLNPVGYLLGLETRIYLKASEITVKREEFLDEVEELKKGSVDYYAAFRAAWRQRREKELLKGKPAPIEDNDKLFEDVK